MTVGAASYGHGKPGFVNRSAGFVKGMKYRWKMFDMVKILNCYKFHESNRIRVYKLGRAYDLVLAGVGMRD